MPNAKMSSVGQTTWSGLVPFAVLRLRPVDFQYVGPTRDRLRAIGSVLAGWASAPESEPYVETVSFRPDPSGGSLAWEQLAADLVRNIRESLALSDHLILDLSYGLSQVNGIQYPDKAVTVALDLCEDDFAVASKKIVLLHSGEVTEVDGFVQRIIAKYSAYVLVADTSTGAYMDMVTPVAWSIPAELAGALVVQPDDVQTQLEQRIVRRRGVFRIPGGESSVIEGFRYAVEQCEAELLELLPRFLRTEKITAVIYDTSVASWFKDVVRAAAVEAEIELCQSTRDLEQALEGTVDPDYLSPNTLADIKGKRVCLVIPMLKSGHNVRKIRDMIEKITGTDVWIVAAMANPADDEKKPGFYTGNRVLGNTATRVSYFAPVVNRPLDENSWLVQVAGIWGEIQDPRLDWVGPSRVGMLSLLDELGAEVEHNVPLGRKRGVAWFPRLARLSEPEFAPDALWLAECLIRAAVKKPDGKRSDLLIVVPDDGDNGARPIARAMQDHLDVHVVRVERDDFPKEPDNLPPRLRRTLKDHASDSIVLFDESAVSYGTFIDLAAMVTRVTGHPPALELAVVEATVQKYQKQRPNRLKSFHTWRPVTFAKSRRGDA